MNEFNPLQLKCSSCGAAVEDFDIVKQEYRCSACGCGISARSVRKNYEHWTHEHAQETAKTVGQHTENGLLCPSCGAEVSFKTDTKGELIQTTCEYCGTHFVASPPGKKFVSPDMIIPFFITLNEAKERLRDWCQQNKSSKEAKLIREKLDELKGYYLPYEVVKGPIRFTVTRDNADGVFICGGYLGGTAVSTNSDQHNLTLDGMEPFDWNGARAYDIGYIVGQSVKLQDIYDKKKLNSRVFEEVEHAYLPVLEKELGTKGITAEVVDEDYIAILREDAKNVQYQFFLGKNNSELKKDEEEKQNTYRHIKKPEWIRGTALLPVYVLDIYDFDARKSFHIAVNGQTGRVSVERIKPREIGRYWWIFPLLIMLMVLSAGFGLCYAVNDFEGTLALVLIFSFIIGLSFTESFRRLRHRSISVIMQGEAVKASRSASRLEIVKEELPSLTETPVFFEDLQGKETPCKMKVLNKKRCVKCIAYVLLTVNIVYILANLLAVIFGIPLAQVNYSIPWNLAWIGISVALIMILFVKLIEWVYSNPVFSYKTADGKDVSVEYNTLRNIKEIIRPEAKQSMKMGLASLIILIIILTSGMLFYASETETNSSKTTTNIKNAEELYNKGLQYQNGEGVEQNYEEAFKYFKLAAEQEYAPAQYEIGICYEYGNGVEADITEAIKWYRLAAEQGNADAYNQLGIVYFDGNGVEQDYEEAFKYFKLAADKGDMYAQYNVGECYEFGDGVEENITEAIKWYKLAAAQGHPEAQEKLEVLE